jgi:ZIP family zinc transporter
MQSDCKCDRAVVVCHVVVAIAAPIVTVAVGLALAMVGGGRPWVLLPIRSFALAAVVVAVVGHLLPEAIAVGGLAAAIVFVAGVAVPHLASKAIGYRRHVRLATELGFVGVLLHQVGDGLVLGTVTGAGHAGHAHWDIVAAIAAHTIPLTAAVSLTLIATHGRRAAIVRAAVLVAATLAGIAATRVVETTSIVAATPWINAAVAGLVIHVLTHDLPTPERTRGARAFELAAVAAGIALPILGSHDDDAPLLLDGLGDVAVATAPLVVIGLAAVVIAKTFGRRDRRPVATIDEVVIHVGPWIGIALVAVAIAAVAIPFDLPEPLRDRGPISIAAAFVLGLVAVRSVWRFGLAAWFEPLHGHHHGQEHEHGEDGVAHDHVHGDCEKP